MIGEEEFKNFLQPLWNDEEDEVSEEDKMVSRYSIAIGVLIFVTSALWLVPAHYGIQKLIKFMEKRNDEQVPDHPLLEDRVLEGISFHLEMSSSDTYKALENARLVCKKWSHYFTPNYMERSQIIINTKTAPAVLKYFSPKFAETNAITSLFIPDITIFGIHRAKLRKWCSSFGHKFSAVTIGHETTNYKLCRAVDLDSFISDLISWFPKVEYLVLVHMPFVKVAKKGSTPFLSLPNNPAGGVKFPHLKTFENYTLEVNDAHSEAVAQIVLNTRILNSLWVEASALQFCWNQALRLNNNLFMSLKHLHLHNFKEEPTSVLSKVDLPSLERLTVTIPTNVPAGYTDTFLNSVCHRLKVLKIVDRGGRWRFARRETHQITTLFPVLQTFQYCDAFREEVVEKNVRTIPLINAKTLSHYMPNLVVFEASQCTWNGVTFDIRPMCKTGSCHHVKDILKHEGCENPTSNLQKFKMSCTFNEASWILDLNNAFPNLSILWIQIRAKEVFKFFEKLVTLSNLEYLRIGLKSSPVDFPLAINTHLPMIEGLTGLALVKSNLASDDVFLNGVAEAVQGFSSCKWLTTLRIAGLKVEETELAELEAELREIKPELYFSFQKQGVMYSDGYL